MCSFWYMMWCQMCAHRLKTRCACMLLLCTSFEDFWRPDDLMKTDEDVWFRGSKWLHVFCFPSTCVHDSSTCLYVESFTLSESMRQESATASLWCTNDPLQSFVGWLKDYFSQKLPKGEIVRFLRVFSFAKISLWSRCGTWCAHIVKTI
jgi:hypothetical protein